MKDDKDSNGNGGGNHGGGLDGGEILALAAAINNLSEALHDSNKIAAAAAPNLTQAISELSQRIAVMSTRLK